MNYGIADEAQTLFDALSGLLEGGALEGVMKPLPLCSNTLAPEQTEEIRLSLQEKLPAIARGAVPIVIVGRLQDDNQAGELHVHFLGRYEPEGTPLGWFVDVKGETCWYFKVADERSAQGLADFFNQPENRRELEAVRPGIRVELSYLQLLLLGLQSNQLDVLKVGYKSAGAQYFVESEMFDLHS